MEDQLMATAFQEDQGAAVEETVAGPVVGAEDLIARPRQTMLVVPSTMMM